MPTKVDPKTTKRAEAFNLWINAPNPMVTVFKTLDVTPLIKFGRKNNLKFNMLMCYCIVGSELIRYDSIAVNTIVKNIVGEVSSCDMRFKGGLSEFNSDYLRLTENVKTTCRNHDITDSMVIGTSALAEYGIDGVVGMYSGIFNNPFVFWGRYDKGIFKTTLKVSFQFHHTQMDGAHAGKFLELLQKNIYSIRNAGASFHRLCL